MNFYPRTKKAWMSLAERIDLILTVRAVKVTYILIYGDYKIS